MLICCHLHSFLNLAKTALKGSVNRLTRTEQIVHGNDGGALQVLYDGRRRLAVNHLEGRHSRAHVLGRVVGPFCKREESKPLRRVLMNYARKYCSRVRLTTSVWPSVCGWYAVLIRSFVQLSLNSSRQKWLTNTGSRSDTILRGNP